MNSKLSSHPRGFFARSSLLLMAGLLASSAQAQPAACDEGVIRLPDRNGTIQICSALAAQVPQLAKQLAQATRTLGDQRTQLIELTRLVRGLNGASLGLGTERQSQLLQNLSAELARSQRGGDDKTKRAVENLSDQLDGLKEQLQAALGNKATATATQAAIQGAVGDAIAKLELGSASRQLDEVNARLTALQGQVGDVKSDTTAIRQKLDRLVDVVDPDNPADRCPDLGCAVMGQASAKAVRKLFDKGAKLPGNRINDGELAKAIAASGKPDRLEVLDLLLAHGLDPNLLMLARVMSEAEMSKAAGLLARDMNNVSRLSDNPVLRMASMSSGSAGLDAWNDLAGCLLRSSGGVTLMELAAMRGDAALYAHLVGRGVKLPQRPLVCQWKSRGQGGGARIAISQGVANAVALP